MKMNDQFSVTLTKYVEEVETAKKKTDEAKISGTGLSSTFKNIGTASETAKTWINGIAGKLIGLILTVYLAKKAFNTLKGAIQESTEEQVQLNNIQALVGNAQAGTALYNYAKTYAKTSVFDPLSTEEAVTSFCRIRRILTRFSR